MNSTLKLLALALSGALLSTTALAGEAADHARCVREAGALLSTTALAGESDVAVASVPVPTRTRAQVQAEPKALPAPIQGDRYPVIEEPASKRTRAEVRAEMRGEAVRIRPEYTGA